MNFEASRLSDQDDAPRAITPFAADVLAVDPDELFSSLERGLPVRLIATMRDLQTCDINEDVSAVLSNQRLADFDYVPVRRDGVIVGLLDRLQLTDKQKLGLQMKGPVDGFFTPLHESCLIAATEGILSFIDTAASHHCRLVLDGKKIEGIVTISDLQKLPVRLAIFLQVTHLELLMTRLIRKSGVPENDWLEILDKGQRDQINKRWAKQRQFDVAIEKIYLANLSHKMEVFRHLFTRHIPDLELYKSEMRAIRELRNGLAHGNDYAVTRKMALRTIDTINLCRSWISRLQSMLYTAANPTGSTVPGTHMQMKRKLIEVALPLEAINKESLHRKQKAPKGWPTSFHKWWAQRPLAAARAVIFAQVVDDPSTHPELFPTDQAQEEERQRLLRIIEDLVRWDNTHNKSVLKVAREEMWQNWRRICAENAAHPEAKNLFDRDRLPTFCDPFAGSGSLPLSAQWLGLDSFASDLNPVAVLICKALIEIPPKFAGKPPVNLQTRSEKSLDQRQWYGAQGLAEDVRYYGQWMREHAEKRVGQLYPKVEITPEIARTRPDLKPLQGRKLTVIAWLWARTVKSPNPAFAHVDVPLASSFILSTKAGKEAYVEPMIEDGGYRFTVRIGKPKDAEAAKLGTTAGKRSAFRCLMSDVPITYDHIRSEGKAGGMGARLMAVVAEGDRGRVYLSPTPEQEAIARKAEPAWRPDMPLPDNPRDFKTPNYGLTTFGDLFTPRQLVALNSFSDLVLEAREDVKANAIAAGLTDDGRALNDGGAGATAYADAMCTYLACVVDRMVYYGSSLASWLPKDNALRDSMPRQALAMTWDFAEGNPFGKSSGDVLTCSNSVSNYLDVATPFADAIVRQCDVRSALEEGKAFLFSTDPPYYDNIGYADLSDFFYVWLRRSLKSVFPNLFATLAVPKAEELVATPYRHGGKEKAEMFFLEGMTQAMHRLAEQAHPAFPVTIYYAFKQSENNDDEGTASTGWETFLEAVIRAGFALTGTWPVRTEGSGRIIAKDTNALASSIVLVCRPRSTDAPKATRREFLTSLKAELPTALTHLQRGNIAPVDLAQAAIGPGMAIYTRYDSVVDAEGKRLSVRDALALINQTLDEALAQQEGDFDEDSRWALAWFEQSGFDEGAFGVADVLARAKNTAVSGLVDAGIVKSKGGKVRLLKPSELRDGWDPASDSRLTVWEMVHHLIRVLEAGGEAAAGELVAKLGVKTEVARELAYRLYTVCERRKRAVEALSYNGLVESWPEIARLAREGGALRQEQTKLFEEAEV